MNLIFEEQVNNVIFGERFDYDDFEDQMQCVAQDDSSKKQTYSCVWNE